MSNSGFAKAIFNGWQFSGITRFWSGNPTSITSSNGNPGTLGNGPRAVYIGGNVYPDNQDRFNYFNPLAFATAADGTFGNLGRNTLRLPGINNWDMSLFKNTKITERITTQLRFEFFNVWNHTQWSGVNTSISAGNPNTPITAATRGTSGQVNSTRDPRSLQMALKLYF
jgi:hypothetical protein